MESFIKKIFEKKPDQEVHDQFVRFSKGEFKNRACINLHITKQIKVSSTFEYANEFVNLIVELNPNVKFSGIILSKEQLDIPAEIKKKIGLYQHLVNDIDSEQIKKIKDKVYFMLLNTNSEDIEFKSKKKLPKPGKSGEKKIDDKFCVMKTDLKYWPKIHDSLFFDLPENIKKAKIKHNYQINEIILPDIKEKDFAKMRKMAKRKGKLIRKITVGKEQEIKKEVEFEA